MTRLRLHLERQIVARIVTVLSLGIGGIYSTVRAAEPIPAGPIHFDEGQKVEVREGDEWSAASIIKHEGRKYLIHYSGAEAATDEWVTSDRIRPAGAVPANALPATQPGGSHLLPNAIVPKPAAVFSNGKQVEVKWGGLWRKAVIVNRRGEWYLIDYDGNKFFREWVEPWRVRTVGSTVDLIGNAPINPSVHHNEGPPREKPGDAPAAGGKGNAPEDIAAASDVPVTAVDRSTSREVDLENIAPLGHLAPDMAGRPVGPPFSQVTHFKGATAGFFDRPVAVMFSAPDAAIAAVLLRDAPPGEKSPRLRIERIDLVTGQSLNVAVLETTDVEMLSLSPDGKLLASRTSVFGPGKGGRLDIWQVDVAGKASHLISFLPFDNARGGEDFITWAQFTDAEHLVVMNRGGDIETWSFRKASMVWHAKAGLQSTASLSPGGKYLALTTQAAIVIIEAATGKPIGRLGFQGPGPTTVSFEPGGSRLAAAAPDLLRIWDTSTGTQIDEVWTVGAAGTSIDWLADGYLLLDGAALVSPAKHAIVWTYSGGGSTRAEEPRCGQLDGRFFYLVDRDAGKQGDGPGLASIVLPDDAVRNVLVAVGDPRMIVKPGIRVSLDISVDGSIQQEVIDSLTAKLKANGITVADNEPIKLVVKSEPGETREMNYRRIGPGAFGQVDKVSIQETKNKVAFTADDGKVLWEKGSTTVPSLFIHLKDGQTIEDAIAEQMKPKPGFFTGITLPKFIPKSTTGFGTSHLGANGATMDKPKPSGA